MQKFRVLSKPMLKNRRTTLPLPLVPELFFFFLLHFQVQCLCSSLFLSIFNCIFFLQRKGRKDNNKAARAAANGEAVIVNGGIQLETSSVNCAIQCPAPGCSDHQLVTKHTQIHKNTHNNTHIHTH